jgi:ribonuclease R
MRVLVRLAEAAPVTGGIALELLEVEGKPMPKGGGGGRGKQKYGGRKTGKNKAKAAKVQRKVTRVRRQK